MRQTLLTMYQSQELWIGTSHIISPIPVLYSPPISHCLLYIGTRKYQLRIAMQRCPSLNEISSCSKGRVVTWAFPPNALRSHCAWSRHAQLSITSLVQFEKITTTNHDHQTFSCTSSTNPIRVYIYLVQSTGISTSVGIDGCRLISHHVIHMYHGIWQLAKLYVRQLTSTPKDLYNVCIAHTLCNVQWRATSIVNRLHFGIYATIRQKVSMTV